MKIKQIALSAIAFICALPVPAQAVICRNRDDVIVYNPCIKGQPVFVRSVSLGGIEPECDLGTANQTSANWLGNLNISVTCGASEATTSRIQFRNCPCN